MDKGNYEFIGDHVLHTYLPGHYPLRLKLMVLAALKTYEMGNKSMDYMLRKYGNVWAEQFEIECNNCGRTVRFKSSFDLNNEDFIVECYRCGHFFCKDCLDWEHPVADEEDDALEVYCLNCSEKRTNTRTVMSDEQKNKKRTAKVIRLDDRRKQR